jgi:2-amino-4-hydroxy-6-hydroxymethyldihydropteridine diphosphokinase
MNITFLQTGTNLGDRLMNLAQTNDRIEECVGKIISTSSIYETEAWGVTDQPLFLNQVLQVETKLTAQEVLEIVLAIELEMGRIRLQKWAERVIDIDVLFYNNEIINKENLIVPHPRIQERNFVLKPLVEIAPNLVHPIFNKKIRELLEISTDKLEVYKFNKSDGR